MWLSDTSMCCVLDESSGCATNQYHPIYTYPTLCAVFCSSHARANTTVFLRDMSLVDNRVSRGSVIVLISSQLETFQVGRPAPPVCPRSTQYACHGFHVRR